MTKKPRTFVLRYIPCGCRVREGCHRCNHTGYRTEHVPLADALLEVEDQHADAYMKGIKQDTAPAKKRPTYDEARARLEATPITHPVYCRECNLTGGHHAKGCSQKQSPTVENQDRCCGTTPSSDCPYHGTPTLLTPHSAKQSGEQVGNQPYEEET